MSNAADAGDVDSLELKLRLTREPRTGAYEVVLELSGIDLVVKVVGADLRTAIREAADRCAAELRDRDYAVTTADVIGALEDALQSSQVVRSAPPSSSRALN